jgi:tripeptide aminopeptidase
MTDTPAEADGLLVYPMTPSRTERLRRMPNNEAKGTAAAGLTEDACLDSDDSVLSRFIRYTTFDTESDRTSGTHPSTFKQFALAHQLEDELEEMGASDVEVSGFCYVYATIPATATAPDGTPLPTLGLIAHLDTASAASGANIHAHVEHFTGEEIVLDLEQGIVLSPTDYPDLASYLDQDIIVTDGTTLLGADDKAGIAEIMTTVAYLLAHPEVRHPRIRIAFTPDEEIGEGPDNFDVTHFDASFAFTLDGGRLGEIQFENFNAAELKLIIHGQSTHPGSAKGTMLNSMLLAMEFQQMLPVFSRPEFTEGREGFYHLDAMTGAVEETSCYYIIRNHDAKEFANMKKRLLDIADYLNGVYGVGTFVAQIDDQYSNMSAMIEPHDHLIDTAVATMRTLDIEPHIEPIRGGTDGAQLSFMGLPCPNLCTGGHNFHSRFEYLPVPSMEKTVEIIKGIVSCYAEPITS